MISISSAFCQALLIAQIWRNIAEDYLMHFASLKRVVKVCGKKNIGCKVGPIFFFFWNFSTNKRDSVILYS